MPGAGDVHHSSRRIFWRFSSILQGLHEQVGEEKISSVTCAKLDLNALLGSLLFQHHHARVVSQYVRSIDFTIDSSMQQHGLKFEVQD